METMPDDHGPFERLGGAFSCNGTPWRGRTIVSPVALYLLQKAPAAGQYQRGGLVGALLAEALSVPEAEVVATCNICDLPSALRAELDPSGRLDDTPVVVVPKGAVSFVGANSYNNAINVKSGSAQFLIETCIFCPWVGPRKLRNLGWVLNQKIVPERGHSGAVRLSEPTGSHHSLATRIVFVVVALVVLAGVVLLRLAIQK